MTTDEHQVNDRDDLGLDTDQSFAKAAIRGSAWGFFQTATSKGLSIVVQLILARLLFPSDFGLVAIAVGTAAVITIFSPLPIIDLLVQRGPRIRNAIVNAWRLCILCALLVGGVIAASSLVVSMRPGQSLETIGGEPATSSTTLAEINTEPPFPQLLEEVVGSFEVLLGEQWVEIRLPDAATPDTSISSYVQLLQERINEVEGAEEIDVVFDPDSARLRITHADGSSLPIRSWWTPEGAVLDTLGISYRSLPLLILLLMLSFQPLLISLSVPFVAMMRLKLRFGQIAGATLSGNVVGYALAIGLAFLGAGPIALMMPQFVFPIVVGVFMYFLARPLVSSRKEDRERKRSIAADSAYLWGAQWIHTATLQAPYLILGFFVSSREVGYYFFAFLLSIQILVLLSQNLAGALTPIFSNLQEKPERLTSAFLRSVGAISGISIPLCLGVAACAPVFIPILFTERWAPSVPFVIILFVSQAFASSNSSSGSLMRGTGLYRTWLVLQVVQGVTVLGAVVLASWLGGAMAVAWTILGQHMIFAPLSIYLCVRGQARKRVIARIHGLPMIACIPMIPVGLVLGDMGPTLIAMLLWTPLLLVGSAILYVLIMRILDRERYDEITGIMILLKNKAIQMLGIGRAHAK